MKCTHIKTGVVLAQSVEQARTFRARLLGLMGRKNLAPHTALLLEPCPQIHTCFMRFDIDVIFLDVQNRAVAVVENIKPWRMSKFYSADRRTLELPGGTLQGRVQPGDELIFD